MVTKKVLFILGGPVLLVAIFVLTGLFVMHDSSVISEEKLSEGVNASISKSITLKLNDEEYVIKKTGADLLVTGNNFNENFFIEEGKEKKVDLNNDNVFDLKLRFDGDEKIFLLKINEPNCAESWECGTWNICVNGKQTRVCEDKNNCSSLTNKPAEIQDCNCIEDWKCESWGNCLENRQVRICSDKNNCGTTENKPNVSRYCEECVEDWDCSEWSGCSGGVRTRTCSDLNSCGTSKDKPKISQSCDEEGINFDEEWEVCLEFISAAENRDVNKMDSLIYTSTSDCFNSYSEEICWEIIDGIANYIEQISKTDIDEVWEDDKQTILSTAIKPIEGGSYGRTQLLFVKFGKEIKYLGTNDMVLTNEEGFLDSDKDGRLNNDEDCSGNTYNHFPESCIETALDKKDSDGDGWWDGIENNVGTNPNDSSSVL